jgi:general stress protein 26
MTQQELIDYINARQFAVISTVSDGYPESACIEFGNDGLTLIFDTNRSSRKFRNLQNSSKVSLVIGWEDERTVQYEGDATLLQEGPELESLKQSYFLKSPEAQKWENKQGSVYFKVEPVWIRFSDPNTDPWDITTFDLSKG